jgi:hypothetical protein
MAEVVPRASRCLGAGGGVQIGSSCPGGCSNETTKLKMGSGTVMVHPWQRGRAGPKYNKRTFSILAAQADGRAGRGPGRCRNPTAAAARRRRPETRGPPTQGPPFLGHVLAGAAAAEASRATLDALRRGPATHRPGPHARAAPRRRTRTRAGHCWPAAVLLDNLVGLSETVRP